MSSYAALFAIVLTGCVRYHSIGTPADEGILTVDARADGPALTDYSVDTRSSDRGDTLRAVSDARADRAKLDGAKPDSAKSDSVKPDSAKSDSVKSDSVKPDSAKPDSVKPDSAKPDSVKPDSAKLDGAKPLDAKPPSTCPSAVGLEFCVSFASVQGKTVHDESGNAHDGTLRGSAVLDPVGKVGPSVRLTGGATDSVDFGLVLGSFPQITVTAWFKLAGSAKSWDAVAGRWDTFKGYWLGGSKVVGGFEWWINGTVVETGKITTTGWTHLAGTFDESTKQVKIYVNGVLQGTKAHTGAITPPTFPLELGHGGTDFTPLNGQIDEVRIWSVVRTQQEICADAGGTPIAGGGCTL